MKEKEEVIEETTEKKEPKTDAEIFKKWYEKNKEELAEKRKQKYRENKEYREKKKLQSTRYYWLKQRRAKSIGMNQVDYEELELETESSLEITIQNENDIRYGMTFEVPIFYPRDVAEVVRRSTQTLRLWFLKELLEDVVQRDIRNHRVFTEDQMKVFVENRHWLSFEVQDFKLHPFFALVNEGLARLVPDGIEPMLKTEWRGDPTPCPFCGESPSLQRLVDGKWEHVECFECKDPTDVTSRESLSRYLVSGTCPYCESMYEDEVELVSGREPRVVCQRCGRLIDEYRKVRIERG